MNKIRRNIFRCLLSFGFLFLAENILTQDWVDINVNISNPNTTLHLVPSLRDEGILISSLTTAQRLAMNFGEDEAGLLVFDDYNGNLFFLGVTS